MPLVARPLDAGDLRPGSAMTIERWGSLPEDEPGEWVDGRLVEEEVPDYVHEVIVAWLVRLLGNWLEDRGGWIGGSEAKFAVSERRGRKADLSVYLPGRTPPARGLVRIPPDILVEVVSATARDGRRDRVEKLNEYARFGVRYYWIVDPWIRSIQMHELGADGRYVLGLSASEGMLDQIAGCPDLRLDLDALWARIDRLERDQPGGA
jgi:Uma2 family endonuclease